MLLTKMLENALIKQIDNSVTIIVNYELEVLILSRSDNINKIKKILNITDDTKVKIIIKNNEEREDKFLELENETCINWE